MIPHVLTLATYALVAQADRPAEEAFYRAFYTEAALRDFAAAERLYADAADEAAAAGDKDLAVRAHLARARVLGILGRLDDSRAAIEAARRADPKSPAPDEMAASLARAGSDEAAIAQRIELDIATIGAVQATSEAKKAAIEELVLIGRHAVPRLEAALRATALPVAAGAAQVLARIGTEEATEALRAALADPAFVYARVVAEAFEPLKLSPAALPVFEAAIARFEGAERQDAASHFSGWCGIAMRPEDAPRVEGIAVRLARDPDSRVRNATFFFEWPSPIRVAVLRAGLSSGDFRDRANAAAAARAPEVRRLLFGDLAGVVESDEKDAPRMKAFESLFSKQGMIADPTPDGDEETHQVRALVASLRSGRTDLAKLAVKQVMERWADHAVAADPLRGALLTAVRWAMTVPLARNEWSLFESAAVRLVSTIEAVSIAEATGLFAAAGGADSRLDDATRREFRERIVGNIYRREGLAMPAHAALSEPELALLRRIVRAGVAAIADGPGLVLWLEYPLRSRRPVADVCVELAGSEDAAVRAVAYQGVALGAEPDAKLERERFPRLGEDAFDGDATLRARSLDVVRSHPRLVGPETLRRLLASGPLDARSTALRALVEAEGKAALPEARAHLRSDDANVRLTAAQGLLTLLGDDAVDEILPVAAETKAAALVPPWFLRDHPGVLSPAAVERYVRGLPRGVANGRYLAEILDYVPEESMRSMVVEALGDPALEFLEPVAALAGRKHLREAWEKLLALTEHPTSRVRDAAAAALEELKRHEEWRRTFERLGDAGRGDAVESARALLGSAEPEKRRGAVLALGALGDAGVVPLLLERLDDADPSVRAAALGALERLGGAPK